MIPIHQMFNKKSLQGRYCLSPFIMIEVMIDGQVRLCGCADWMPIVVGNLFENSLPEILASPLARDIRQSIINGTYEYCNDRTCGILLNDQLNSQDLLPPNVVGMIQDAGRWEMPYEISLSGDLTCNLSCPSCRTQVIRVSDDRRQHQEDLGRKLADNLFSRPTDQRINIIVSNSGEIFASPLLLKFVNSIDLTQFPNLVLNIQTNGLLAPERWHRLGPMQDRVPKTTMTLDAARADTYEQVRRGGRWVDAMAAMEFLQNRRRLGMRFHVRMVVQESNWREIREFYDLARRYNADTVEYVRLTDWRTWSPSEFRINDVFHSGHPNRVQAQSLMAQVRNMPDVFVAGDFG